MYGVNMERTFISHDDRRYIEVSLLVVNCDLKYIGDSIYYICYTVLHIYWHIHTIVEAVPNYILAIEIIWYVIWSHLFSEKVGINMCLEHKWGANNSSLVFDR